MYLYTKKRKNGETEKWLTPFETEKWLTPFEV
jgi:hypothetical protein